MERCIHTKGSLKSILWYAGPLSGDSIPCFHIPSFLRAQRGEWLQSGGCYRAHNPSFLSALRAHQLKVEGCNRPCLLIWQEICHFSTLSVQFSRSVMSNLCNPTNRSTPGLPVHHQIPELTQTHVTRVGDAIQPSHPLSSPSPPALNTSQHQGLFQ